MTAFVQREMAEAEAFSKANADLDVRIERVLRKLGLVVADSWMNPAEAAGHARISRWHLLRLCREGRGPEAKGEGKMMRFRRSAVDRWLNEGCERAVKEAGNKNCTHAAMGTESGKQN